jgi:hypothetical protein
MKTKLNLQVLRMALGSVLMTAATCQAIDPLPPELENAPLEKKAAYWQKTSREGGELRHKVAMQRWEQALARKQAALERLEERASAVRAEVALSTGAATHEQQAEAQAVAGPPDAEDSSTGLYWMLGAMLVGGAFVLHRKMQEAEQPA